MSEVRLRLLFAGHKERGIECLAALRRAGHEIVGVVGHAGSGGPGTVAGAGATLGVPVMTPADPNAEAVVAQLRALTPDLTVLAGFGPIVKAPFREVARLGAVNLHGGRLPEYRGSSPMNWALINGEREFSISIIEVDGGVDTGPVLAARTFPVGPDDTIADVQGIANQHFPEMLVEVVDAIARGAVVRRVQSDATASYYPLRFPGDGLVLWDQLTADDIHNRIRALTDPYPGAFTYFDGRRVRLKASRHTKRPFYGEPGRIYVHRAPELLVCARDRCLWLVRSEFEETKQPVADVAKRYDRFATIAAGIEAAFAALATGGH